MKSKSKLETRSTPQKGERKKYTQPKLIQLGDIRDLTLGTSPGTGDSQGPSVLQVGT